MTDSSADRLRRVIEGLVSDCAGWYSKDTAILEEMSEQDLERTVLDYLARRDYYRQGQSKRETRERT